MSAPLACVSTRGGSPPVALDVAIAAGLAPDGGLYVPQALPRLDLRACPADASLADTAQVLLAPFFAGGPLEGDLAAICSESLAPPVPRAPLPGRADAEVMELFHGPTAAFKDYAARFLAACLRRLRPAGAPPLTLLVATSGDTGAAVAAACHGLPGLRVVILYPDGRVSPRQAHQLGCFGGNVEALRVAGTFDDCQRMVKAMLADAALQARVPLSSANSISLGRLLPQMSWFAQAALACWQTGGVRPGFVVPTGNLGHAVACVWARAMGLPIGRIVLACNANATLPRFFAGEPYAPRAALATLANAMDVGAPSNFERLAWTLPEPAELRASLTARSADDAAIRATLQHYWREHSRLFCPHTAAALHALSQEPERPGQRWIVAATAAPAKFEGVLEPLLGTRVPVPASLAALLARPAHAEPLAAEPEALRRWLLERAG